MSRRYAFLAGLPRSGSHLLSALLNQHPEIYASPHNNALDIMFDLAKIIPEQESWKMNIRRDSYKKIVGGVFDSYFSDRKESLILDKNRLHGTPNAIELVSNFLTEDIKIIFPVRPLLEILASFINIMGNEPNTEIDKTILNDQFPASYYRNINDVRCDWLMKPYNLIDTSMLSLSQAFSDTHKNKFHLVEYKNLCTYPQETLNNIFDFLGVEKITLDFSNIRLIEDHDTSLLGIPDMHKIRSTIGFQSPPVKETLSDYVINKYSVVDFWTKI